MNAQGEAALKKRQEAAPAHEKGFVGLLRPPTSEEKMTSEERAAIAQQKQAAADKIRAEEKALEDELVPGTLRPRPVTEMAAAPVTGAISFSAFSDQPSPFMAFARSGSDYEHVQL